MCAIAVSATWRPCGPRQCHAVAEFDKVWSKDSMGKPKLTHTTVKQQVLTGSPSVLTHTSTLHKTGFMHIRRNYKQSCSRGSEQFHFVDIK